MKDNRTSPFLSDLSGVTKTLGGSLFLSASSYVRFNDFLDTDTETGTRLLDFASNNQYTVQSGSANSLGAFALATGSLVDLNIYGQRIYTDLEVRPGYKVRTIAAQRGFRLPIVPASDGSAHDPIFIGRDLNDIWPTSPPSGWSGLTFMLKFVVRGVTNNKSLITVAEGPGPTADGAFNVAFTNAGNIQINHKISSGADDASVEFAKNTVWQVGQFLTLFIHVNAFGANPRLDKAMLFDTATGELLGERSSTGNGTMVSLSSPKLYVGYGELDGTANYSFPLSSFLKNVDIAELAIFGPLTGEQMELVARSSLVEVGYKSGFNNRPVSRTQQLFDARTVYPASTNPAIGQADPSYAPTPAFNDQNTKFFGTGSALQAQRVMFPEMLPAHMFSGSSVDRGAVGDVKSFYRDAHHTDYDKRLVTRAALRQGLSHKETEILNIATRNSPIVIGEDSDALGSGGTPFNDNHPLADQNTSEAVSVDTYPGLQQRLGDHVAIVIELNPAESTTVGVERTGGAQPWLGTPTGRVTSMAYFNFATKKWETAGKNNDFVIPGAITVGTGSGGLRRQKIATVAGGFAELFKSSSVGFAGTSGFTIYQNQGSNAFDPLSMRGNPTSNYGFPIHKKYEAKDNQLIDMSDYIDAPFVLEKVSLEFGAAVEESGPHSLGYRMATSRFDPDEPINYYDPETFTQPSLRFYVSQGSPAGAPFQAATENLDSFLKSTNVYLNRGEFINGAWVTDLYDFKGQAIAGPTAPPYSNDPGPDANALFVNPDLDTFGRSQSSYVSSIILANENHSRFNDSKNPVNAETDYVRGPGIYFQGPNKDPYFSYTRAQLFLPTVLGPRATGSLGAQTTGSAQTWQKRTLTSPEFPLSMVGIQDDLQDYTLNYIPVLAGGANGIVTGAVDMALTAAGGPWLAVDSIPYAPQPEDAAAPKAYLGGGGGWQDAGGVPFWRADTFFLLRQTKKSPSSEIRYTFRINIGSSKVYFPLAPYTSIDQPQLPMSGTRGEYVGGDASVNHADSQAAPPFRAMHGTVNPGYSEFLWPANAGSDSANVDPGPVAFTWSNVEETNREIIGFGQMVHYGHAAAQTSYMDTVWEVDQQNLFSGVSSGSMDVNFKNQIYVPDPLNPGDYTGERMVPLFGQALKLSRLGSPNLSTPPGNIGRLDQAEKSSAFSDFPDTHQGQYSQVAGEQSADNYTTVKKFSLLEAGSPVSRREGGTARYWQAGSAPPPVNWNGGFNFIGTEFEHAHTLDTWEPYPRKYGSNTDAIANTRWRISGSQSSSVKDDGSPNVSIQGLNNTHSIPGGAGFSLIATPAWPVRGPSHREYTPLIDSVDNTGGQAFPPPKIYPISTNGNGIPVGIAALSDPTITTPLSKSIRYWDDVNFGTFTTPPPGTSDKTIYKRSVSVEPGRLLGDVPKKNWLDSGLRKELMIEVGEGARHEGTNIDPVGGVYDNWSGFTLMTASTIWRPYESPGRESAALPLHANVYKRQWLNYFRQKTIEFNVKSVNPSTIEDSGYWVVTSEDPYGPQPDPNYGTTYTLGAEPPLLTPSASNVTLNDHGEVLDRARAKRFHRRWSSIIEEGGFSPGARADSLSSGRSFIRAAGATTKSAISPSQQPIRGGLQAVSKTGDKVTNVSGTTVSFYEDADAVAASIQTGSIPTNVTQDSLYVLQPSDKLILGIQPSLPGWNAGSGLPNNRWAKKYGVWDYDSMSSSDAGPPQHDVDSLGRRVHDPKMNLEDPYEPCHGLTMLQGRSRLVLYGTFLRDNKHYSPSSKQQLRSAAVHEALHYDNPVLDQYLTSNRDEYVGSYLEQHITGTIEGTTDPRSVAGTATRGDLVFSGSFQRFTRAVDTSQVFYDTLPQNPLQICSVDGFISAGNPSLARVINMHHASPKIASASAAYYDYVSLALPTVDYPYALNGYWTDSFPFEQKYAGVDRMVERNVKFLSPLGLEAAFIGMGGGLNLIGADPVTADNSDGQSPGEASKLPGGSLAGIDKIGKDDLEAAIDSYANFLPSVNLFGIRNMSSVLVPAESADIETLSQTFPTSPNSENASKLFRMFFANMIGYGRKNRKKLDISHDRWRFVSGSAFGGGMSAGRVIGLHPAGFKFGYMNCDHLSPSAVHRGDRYGQFRDMLEQRLYSKVYSYGDELTKRGESEAAVSAIFVDADGAPLSDPTQTQCLNLSTAMTASKPYIEGESLREIILSSESVTIE